MRLFSLIALIPVLSIAQWHMDFDDDFASATSVRAWTPLQLPSLKLWLDAQDTATLTLSNDFVTAWADKSGNGNNGTQATVANRKRYLSSDPVANNKPSVTSTNALGFMNVTTPSFAASQFFIVMAFGNGATATFSSYYNTILSSTGVNGANRVSGQISTANWFGTSTWANGAYTNGSESVSTVALPMPLSIVRFDGSSQVTQVWGIGCNLIVTDRSWTGPICEVIAVSTNLPTADRKKLEAYLGAKWGINVIP